MTGLELAGIIFVDTALLGTSLLVMLIVKAYNEAKWRLPQPLLLSVLFWLWVGYFLV